MKIDLHAHFRPDVSYEIVDAKGRKSGPTITKNNSGKKVIVVGKRVRAANPASDPKEYIRDMDRIGLDMMALSVLPPYIFYDVNSDDGLTIARRQNDALAEVVQANSDRFVGMATVPMQDARKAASEVERAIRDLRFKGVEIAASVNGKNLDEPEFRPFFEKVQELDVPIFVHPIAPIAAGVERMQKYFLENLIGNPLETTLAVASIIFGGVLEDFPRLKFVFAHSGGYTPFIRGRWEQGYQFVAKCRSVPRPPSEYLKMMYFDCLNHFEPALAYLVDTVGPDRVVLGSDYPADMALFDTVSHVRNAAGISASDKEKILEVTGPRLLGL
jgi:aminocarboxymuconate-semialdehyde decarboxylase